MHRPPGAALAALLLFLQGFSQCFPAAAGSHGQRRGIGRAAALLFALAAVPVHAASILVDSLQDGTGDDGSCTLREALTAAALDFTYFDCPGGSGADTIGFEASLFAGTPATATIVLDPAYGALAVSTGDVTVAPPPGARLVLQGDGGHGILHTGSGAFTARDITVRGGRDASGAGMALGSGAVLLERVHFEDNVANGFWGGGAIYRNAASGGGGLVLRECRFEGNHATQGGGGALSLFSGGDYDVTIEDAVFAANTSLFNGGAASIRAGDGQGAVQEVAIRRSVFSGNSAHAGGALSIQAVEAASALSVVAEDSAFQANSAGENGGALYAEAHEQAAGASVTLRRSSLRGNSTGGAGGGIRIWNAHVRIENSLFLDNEAAPAQGGALVVDQGGATLPRQLALVANTFADNRAGTSSDSSRTLLLYPAADASGWSWTIVGNAFSGTLASTGAGGECTLHPAPGLALLGGANAATDPACQLLPGDLVAEDLGLAATAGAGVHSLLLAPRPGSPLLDLWPGADCLDAEGAPLLVDLAGNPRPRDGDGSGSADCDAGAVELPDAGLLSVTHTGAGSGRVVSAPAGIDCGSSCSVGFTGGTPVTLTATADAGSVFGGWSGACSGVAACDLVIDGDAAAEAEFVLEPSHSLAVALAGDGEGTVVTLPSGIACAPVCNASFAAGSTVTLSATPAFDAEFTGWSGDGCSGTGDCSLTLAADATVTASFAATAFLVDVARTGTGEGTVTSTPAGIACPGQCAALFPRDDAVGLTAVAATGSVFTGWDGSCSGTSSCVLAMDGAHAVDARFERLRQLTVQRSGNGSGSVSSSPAGIACPGTCSAPWAHGTQVTLTAAADAGSAFAGWSGAGCAGTGTCTVTLNAASTVTANFQTGSNALQVTVTGPGSVASQPAGISCPADCSEVFTVGSVVTLVPTAAAGQAFLGWSGACSGTGACSVSMDAARQVGASFGSAEVFASGFE